MTARLILGSASPARLRLLRDAGFDPEVVVSGVDESLPAELPTGQAVAVLAARKADAVVAMLDAPVDGARTLVLACDSLLELDGRSLGKPKGEDDARESWSARRGKTGVLHTGHALVDPGRDVRIVETASTVVHFASPSDAEIDAYVASGEPFAVAGGFTIDGRGAVFIDRIDGDHGNVIGLSLPLLRRMLAKADVAITELWT